MDPPSNFNCRCRVVVRKGIFARWWELIRRYPPSKADLAFFAFHLAVVLWWFLR